MPARRLYIPLRITLAGLLAGLALSWPLWNEAARNIFPLVPLLPFPLPVGAAAWGIGLTALAAFIFPDKKILSWLLTATLILACLADLNRCQPWVWFYFLSILVHTIADDDASAMRWLLAAVYAWSGLNKITPYFLDGDFPWFCSAFSWLKPFGEQAWGGYLVAIGEFLLAPALLWHHTRRIAMWLTIALHGWIILLLSPLGLHWNAVVIPWNIAMAGLVWWYFREKSANRWPASLSGRTIAGIAWLGPVLFMAGWWPYAFSWKMYSNTQPEATFYLDAGETGWALKPVWHKYAFDADSKLLLDDWSQEELHVPVLPQRRAFLVAGRYLCGCLPNPDSAGIIILTVHPWQKSAEQVTRIPCRTLLNQHQ